MHGVKVLGTGLLFWLAVMPIAMASEPAHTSSASPPGASAAIGTMPAPYKAKPEQLALLHRMAARDVDPDRMKRCLDYPDPPGVQWNVREVALFCALQFDPVLTLAQLKQRFDSDGAKGLDRYFAGLRRVQDNDAQGWKLDEAMTSTFGCACKEARDLADAWLAAAPKSPWAWVASGLQYSAAAGEARGTEFFQDTPPERVARMEKLDAKAVDALEHALSIDPRLTPAISEMIWVDAREGRAEKARARLFAALGSEPGNMALHMTAATMLQAKWVGSGQELTAEKQRAQQGSARYPALLMVVSKIAWSEKACKDCTWSRDEIEAANRIGPSLPIFRELMRQAMTAHDFATVAIYASEVLRLSKTTEIWARVQRGMARVQMGDLDGAEEDGEAALAVKAGYQPAMALMQLVSYKRKAATHAP